jgi:hypothetical protein
MGCCNSTSLKDELIEAFESYLNTLSLTQDERDKIKDEITNKINLSIDTDEDKLSKLSPEDRHLYIEDKKKQIKNELDCYIILYDKLQEKKTTITLNAREKSIINELEIKIKAYVIKYKVSPIKKVLIENTWRRTWNERIHRDVQMINTMTIESRDKYISVEWYDSEKYLDTLYSIAVSRNNF